MRESCVVKKRCDIPDTVNGGKQTRIRYKSDQVSAPASCESETQIRMCSDGNWGVWSGNYMKETCKVHAGNLEGCEFLTKFRAETSGDMEKLMACVGH